MDYDYDKITNDKGLQFEDHQRERKLLQEKTL